MQHPAESGRYVKLYNAMLYLHCELNCLFNLLVNNRLKNSIYYCFYIRQYVKEHFHLPFYHLPFGHLFIHLVIRSFGAGQWRITDSNR